jgi:hypothetical protein
MLVNSYAAVDRRGCGKVDNYRGIKPHQTAGLQLSTDRAKYPQAIPVFFGISY